MDSFQQAGFLSDRVITGLLVRPICSEAVDTPLQTVTFNTASLVLGGTGGPQALLSGFEEGPLVFPPPAAEGGSERS